jgi:hypothetical protein
MPSVGLGSQHGPWPRSHETANLVEKMDLASIMHNRRYTQKQPTIINKNNDFSP